MLQLKCFSLPVRNHGHGVSIKFDKTSTSVYRVHIFPIDLQVVKSVRAIEASLSKKLYRVGAQCPVSGQAKQRQQGNKLYKYQL